MKKKFLFTTIAAAAFATAALGIAACDDPEPEEQPEAPSPYTVTFDANGGAFASTVNTPVVLEVNAENKLAAFPTSNPTHASSATHDYSFAGWTVTPNTLPLLDLNKVYGQSTTVYAYWNTTPKQGGVTSTYTVTFHGNGGLWGTDTEKELTTNTSGLLASLPATPVHPDDKPFKGYTIGTTDTGNYIDVSTPYTENTDVYAQWGNAPLVAGDYNLYVNGVLVNNALEEGNDGADERPANLVFNYFAENVVLHAGDTVRFVLKEITIDSIWAKAGTAIQGVTGFQDSQGKNITGDTVTVLADATYTVSISRYQDQVTGNTASVYIGPYDGTYESGGQGDDDDDETHTGGIYIGTTLKTALTDNTSGKAPTEKASIEMMATGVMLSPGDVITFKVDDVTLTHTLHVKELWPAEGCHGVSFDQTTGEFTVGGTGERSFDIYVRYYKESVRQESNPNDQGDCWSIYISDGIPEVLVAGGAYLVGEGFTNATWDLATANYIDPTNGLTITVEAGAKFKICSCSSATTGDRREWLYNAPDWYQGDSGLDYSRVGASESITVVTPGRYKVTISGTGSNVKFTFTKVD